jgi:muconolactone delta-isomerase
MQFMLKMTWNRPIDNEIMALMPAEQARITELTEQGVHETAYLAADRSTLWSVWNCASQDQVQESLETLPLFPFSDFEITPLGEEG